MKVKHIFFIGIGGKGLNGIAQICLQKGAKVSGVDLNNSPEVMFLKDAGAKIYNSHSSGNVERDVDAVVYSSIVPGDCPELTYSKQKGIKICKRSKFLKEMIRDTMRISVSGSHGKSTTTAILGLSMVEAGLDPDIYCGAYIKEFGAYNRLGGNKFSVTEACEYDRSFFDLVGDSTIITSLEKSHLEYYKDEAEMFQAFTEFVQKHSDFSPIIVCGDDPNIQKIIVPYQSNKRIITYGFEKGNDFVIRDISMRQDGTTFSIYSGATPIIKDLQIKIPGMYNVWNYTAVVVLFHQLNFDIESIRKVASKFEGVGRRFEISKLQDGKIFVDDFAHHPTQVKNLFYGLKQFFPDKKICAIFQPRQFNLIKNFIREYGQSFKLADEIILTDIVPALGDKEDDLKSIDADDVANSIALYSGKKPILYRKFEEIVNFLHEKLSVDSVIATIGAGDIYKIKEAYTRRLNLGSI